MEFTYNKNLKLKRKKEIDLLFSKGRSISAYPLRLVYVKNNSNLKVGVSVSKRFFKLAVHRNRIKRLLRESFRLNKTLLPQAQNLPYSFMILYSNKTQPDFETIHASTHKLLLKFIAQHEKDINNKTN